MPAKVTDPFVCVFTDDAAWQSVQTAPWPVAVVRCGACELLASVDEVALWHSVQLFTELSAVFHVYEETTVPFCPLL